MNMPRRFLNHECQIIWHNCKWIIFPSSNRNELLKVEPVPNGDWLKSFSLFLGLSAGENSNKTQLTSSAFSAPLLFAFSLLLTLFTLFSKAFCLPYSRCSALDICSFTWAFSCPLLRSSGCYRAHFFHVISRFFTFFRLARTYYYFSPYPTYFHWNPVATNLN